MKWAKMADSPPIEAVSFSISSDSKRWFSIVEKVSFASVAQPLHDAGFSANDKAEKMPGRHLLRFVRAGS